MERDISKNRIAILVVVVILAGGLIWNQKTNKPIELEGKPMAQVVEPALTAAANIGKEKFNTYCAACHGADAAGREGIGPPFVHVIYKSDHHGDLAFYRATQLGVRAHHWTFGDMPPVQGVNQKDISDIIIYIRELQQANRIY